MTMCYACTEYAATWGPHVGRYAREPICEDTPSAEEVRTPTRAYLDERTPGTSIHERWEMIRNALDVPPGQMTNAEMDRFEEGLLRQRREEQRLRDQRTQYSMVPLDPRQTHVVIARVYSEFVRFCNENGLRVRGAIHVRPDDRMGDRLLMGLANIAIHRVDGAMAEDRVESYLRHLVSTGRAADQSNPITHDADGELRPAYRASPTGRNYATPVQMQGMSAYHYVVDEAGHFMRGQEAETRAEAFSRFYGSGRNMNPERGGTPGDNYRPHGEIHTNPEPTAMRAPHHWATTLERSPFWYRAEGVLRTEAGDYKPEELDLDIRYV